MKVTLPVFSAALLLLCTLHAQDLPKAPHSQVTALTPGPGYFTEPSVAVNPNNPQQMVAVFQDNAHAAYSQDAGQTWTVAEGVAPKNYRVSGDVSTVFDNQGHAFICYIAFDKLGTFNYWAHDATRNGIFVRRSLDGGKSWEAEHVPVAEQPSTPGIPFEDKPYIAADNSKGKFAGNLYVGWTRWRIADSQMVISRSTDDGKTWSAPIEVDAHPGLPRDDNGAAEGFDGAVGPDGTLYGIWSQDDDIFLVVSKDGGKTFSHARSIIHTAPIMFAIDTLERANGFPQIAVDPKSKRLYVTWSDYRNGDLDVFLSNSSDGGKHWSAAVRVNNDPVHDGAEQFFQWLAVDPVDGSVNVMFYDRRRDPQNRKQIVVLARSTDAGRSFNNYAWTEEPFEAGGVFFGDYSGLAAYGGRVYGVWTEKPVPPPASETNEKSGEAKESKPAPKGTVVKVGTADFGTTSHQ
ncbi:MAG TPA: sialidase family protein [Candidatus Sulfotelmatobacter sp.]|nr:sialidase family protein [Candidatus Sulfotelmatobacter sp.]